MDSNQTTRARQVLLSQLMRHKLTINFMLMFFIFALTGVNSSNDDGVVKRRPIHRALIRDLVLLAAWNKTEVAMLARGFLRCSVSTLAGVAMLAVSLSPASALTLVAPSLEQPFASSQIEKVWWCRWGCGWGWRGPGPGWGPAAVAGGVVAGTVAGAAIAGSPAYAGPPVYAGGPCWRRWIGPYGRVHWRRVC